MTRATLQSAARGIAPAPNGRPVAVVAAMSEEIAPLRSRVEPGETFDAGPCRVYEGRWGGARVILAHTGDGRQRAEAGIGALLDRLDPRLP
jgi:nucleoside phosphorylase